MNVDRPQEIMIHLLELSVAVFSQNWRLPTVKQCIVLRLAGSLVEDKNWFCRLWCVSKESEASVAIFIGTFWFVFRPGQVLKKRPASTELKKNIYKKIDTLSHYYEKKNLIMMKNWKGVTYWPLLWVTTKPAWMHFKYMNLYPRSILCWFNCLHSVHMYG